MGLLKSKGFLLFTDVPIAVLFMAAAPWMRAIIWFFPSGILILTELREQNTLSFIALAQKILFAGMAGSILKLEGSSR